MPRIAWRKVDGKWVSEVVKSYSGSMKAAKVPRETPEQELARLQTPTEATIAARKV